MSDDLYLCSNSEGRVIYVGRTTRRARRFSAHRQDSAWWPDVSSIEVREGRGPQEADTIWQLRPEHNRWGNPDWRFDGLEFVPIMRPLKRWTRRRRGAALFIDLHAQQRARWAAQPGYRAY